MYKTDTPKTHVVISEDINAFGTFMDTRKEVFVLNNKALVTSINSAKKSLGELQKSGRVSQETVRSIPVPDPRPGQTFEDATRILFDFLSRSMNINTMAESHEVHYSVQPGKRENFKDLIIANTHSRQVAANAKA